jgi:hypothetical protein
MFEAHMSVRRFTGPFVAIAALAVSACTYTSDGLELAVEEEAAVVTFNWQSSDDSSGVLTAALTDVRQFRGPYFRIAKDTHLDQLAPLWDGWTAGRDWQHWQPGPDFLNLYGGKVLASLSTPGGERMRCRFRFAHAASGMVGGGEGTCQLADGTTLHATFPPARGQNIAVRF